MSLRKSHICLFLILAVFSFDTAIANPVLGKVSIQSSKNGKFEVKPLISGSKLSLDGRAIIKLSSGTLILDKDSVIQANGTDDNVSIDLVQGVMAFRVYPDRARLSINTDHGIIKTKEIIRTTTAIAEGKVDSTAGSKTVVTLFQGEVELVNQNGKLDLNPGEMVTLTDENSKMSQNGNNQYASAESTSGSQTQSTGINGLPEGLMDLMSLIGSFGLTRTELVPDGVVAVTNKAENMNSKVVDYALQPMPAGLAEGRSVKVVCVKPKGEDEKEILVRAVDSYYPENTLEIDMIGAEVVAEESISPFGFSKLTDSTTGRSIKNWNTVVVDEDMNPTSSDDIARGTELNVICIRSTLILQPVDVAATEDLALVGKSVMTTTGLSPGGTVTVNGLSKQALYVDLNLNPVDNVNMPEGSTLEVVAVKRDGSGEPVLLVQKEQDVLKEVGYAKGNRVSSIAEFNDQGIFRLNGSKWWGRVVDAEFNPIAGTYSANTEFVVVGVDTTLLVNTPKALLAFWEAGAPVVTGTTQTIAAVSAIGAISVFTPVAGAGAATILIEGPASDPPASNVAP